MIDHSILHPTTTVDEFEAGIDLAIAYDVASVCLMPFYVRRLAERLRGTSVIVSTVIGFPHGGHTTQSKRNEAEIALSEGCQELDMVVNINRVVSGDFGYVRDDIAAVIEVAHAAGQKVKVIFENCYLSDFQKIRLCEICNDLSADWVKTSTGYGTSGATIEDLKLMREHADASIQVKAAGGVRDFETLREVHDLGVSRCGTSRTPGLLDPLMDILGMPRPTWGGDQPTTTY
ncbi:MAG: deoxyribose-phosphate aldolase [Planctomycetota bacterium]